MAKIVIERFTSDLSGEAIEEGDAWRMILQPEDGRKQGWQMDISTAEAEAFMARGGEPMRKRRGRPKGSRNKPKE
jgi:hypothetical protein